MEIQDKTKAQSELQQQCSEMGRVIAKCIPEGVGFALIFTDFGDSGAMSYISNAERGGMVKLFREVANKIEGAGN